ncbi:MAG TPA: penicillin-binding protein [Bacteroidales bacterium]|nr:penicillin-binding protein [Bacteroidales bacterium]
MNKLLVSMLENRWFRRGILVVITTAVLFLVVFFSFRNLLLNNVLKQKQAIFMERFDAELIIRHAHFKCFLTLQFDSVMLKPRNGDTLVTIGSMHITPSVMKLMTGRLSPENLVIDRLHINLTRRDSLTNYMFLLRGSDSAGKTNDTTSQTSYARMANQLVELFFEKLPVNTRLTGFRVMADLDGNRFVISTPEFDLSDKAFSNQVWITNQGVTAPLTIKGELNHGGKSARISLFPTDTTRINLPYIDWKWKALVGLDTLRFSVSFDDLNDDRLTIRGEGTFTGLRINQPMISEKTVRFDKLAGQFVYNIGSDYIELDSSSVFSVNELTLNPWLKVYLRKPYRVSLHLRKPPFPAQQFFESLPDGLFLNLQGMEVSGELSYRLDFDLDMRKPDSLQFFSNLEGKDFKINKYGQTNLTFINGSFQHTAYEHGVPVRTFIVGPENQAFRPLNSISPYLRYAIMTAEDGGFMWHRGFLPDAFRGAIIDNVKAGRFVRGGSTISMQLVKNVFLNRNKTVTRKLEEALIVWLIENKRLSSKERMYEVYLNIIEMGPLVYGVQEGAQFYFGKDVSKLTLAESIFMASIVPHPKWFRYSFDEGGHLRDFLGPYYSFLANRMAGKGFITEAEAAMLKPDIILTGSARKFLSKSDSTGADSLRMALPVMEDKLPVFKD